MKKTPYIGGVATMLTCLVAACGSGGGSNSVAADCKPVHPNVQTVKPGVLTVSTFVSPPYSTLDRPGGTLGGIDGEIVGEIAKMECLAVDANPVTGAALTEGVKTGRADVVIGGVYFTPQRQAEFSLSNPMYRDGMAFVSKGGFATLADMGTRKLGVVQGQLWNDDLQRALGQDHVVIYQDIDGMVADVQVGRIDAGTMTTAEAGFRASQAPDLKVAQVLPDPRVAASKGDSGVILLMSQHESETTKAFNDDIDTLLHNGRIAALLEAGKIDPKQAGSA
jgi:polar amino acid transport system substrate-binding protein